MKRALVAIGYGVGGVAVAAALTLGGFALAGKDLSSPAGPVDLGPNTSLAPSENRSAEPRSPSPKPRPRPTTTGQTSGPAPAPTRSPDDHGGSSSGPSPSSDGSDESGGDGHSGDD